MQLRIKLLFNGWNLFKLLKSNSAQHFSFSRSVVHLYRFHVTTSEECVRLANAPAVKLLTY